MPRIDLHIYAINADSPRTGPWDTGWRVLPSVLIEAPQDGAWRCDVVGGHVDVSDGEVLLLPAGLQHRLRNRPGAAMRSSWAYIDWQADRPLPLPDRPLVLPAGELPLGDLLQAGDSYAALVRRQRAGWQVLERVLATCPLAEESIDPRILRCLRWCEDHLSDVIDRDRMAALAGLSPTRFHAVFSAALGQAPMRWLAGRRLRRAQQLLLTSTLAIGAIAERCGFSSPYYFSRAFHQACGQTPTQYRRQHRR